jgi:hypothetical protein
MRYLDGHLWMAPTLSLLSSIKYGGVSCNLVTVEATKFVGPHKSYMRQYIIKLVHSDPTDAGLNRHKHDLCHTPFRENGNEASIRVPRMFKSHVQ